jgi:hypothetical protein
MTQRFKPEQPPWQPRIDEPVPFHTGVPPRSLVGEVTDRSEQLDDVAAEEAEGSTADPAPPDRTERNR